MEHEQARVVLAGLAFDLDSGAQTEIDEIPVGEAHIRFERAPAGGAQPIAQPRHVTRPPQHHPRHRLPRQIAQPGDLDRDAIASRHQVEVAHPDEEVGTEAIVLDQEARPRFEATEELDDRPAALQPIGRLEDQSAHRLRPVPA